MSARAGPWHQGPYRLPLALLLAALPVWLTALAGPFQFDDYNVIVDFAPVHSLAAWWQALPGIRPLLKLSYALNWTVSPAPFGFHLVNLGIHLLNGLLLLAWARRVLPLSAGMAFALALLWLLHPVQTEAVTYIAGRSVALSTTCLLAGLWVLAQAPRGAGLWAALFTLLGLAVRETAWVFPLAFALVEYLRGRPPRAIARLLAPSGLVVLVAALGFLIEPHYRHLIEVSLATRDGAAQARAQVLGLGYLLAQLVTLRPNLDPALAVPPAWTPVLLLQGLALIAGLGLALGLTLARRSWAAAGLAWFFLLLLPTNGVMPRLDIANDRHLYGALIGPLWSLVVVLAAWRHRQAAVAALALVLAGATLIRNEDYRSEVALWARTTAQSSQQARAWNNLGMACLVQGERDCARQAFRQARALAPADPRAAVNLYFLERRQAVQPSVP